MPPRSWKLFLLLLMLAAASGLLTPRQSLADLSLQAIADTWVNQFDPNTNKGGQNILYASNNSDNEPGCPCSGNDVAYVWLMFDLSSLQGSSVTHATLNLQTWTSYTPVTATVGAFLSSSNSWIELGITWNNQPSNSISSIATSTAVVASTGTLYGWDVTSAVQATLSSGKLSIVLKVISPGAFVWFYSRETSNPPYLSVSVAGTATSTQTISGTTSSTTSATTQSSTVSSVTTASVDHSIVAITNPTNGSIISGPVSFDISYNIPALDPVHCSQSISMQEDGVVVSEQSGSFPCYPQPPGTRSAIFASQQPGPHVLRVEVKESNFKGDLVGWWYDQVTVMVIASTSTQTSSSTSIQSSSTAASASPTTSSTSLISTTTVTSSTTSSQTVTRTVTATTTLTTLTISSTQSGRIASSPTYLQISSNSTISNLQFDSKRGLINFTASGPPSTVGFTSVVFAKSLINGSPTVLIDGGRTSPISLSMSSNSTHYFLSFSYPHSTHSITVGGSNTIPEFGVSRSPIIFTIIAVSLFLMRRRMRIHSRKRIERFPIYG